VQRLFELQERGHCSTDHHGYNHAANHQVSAQPIEKKSCNFGRHPRIDVARFHRGEIGVDQDSHEREQTGRDDPAAKSLSEQRANRSEKRDQRKRADAADR
jgi:hypothetical protein